MNNDVFDSYDINFSIHFNNKLCVCNLLYSLHFWKILNNATYILKQHIIMSNLIYFNKKGEATHVFVCGTYLLKCE